MLWEGLSPFSRCLSRVSLAAGGRWCSANMTFFLYLHLLSFLVFVLMNVWVFTGVELTKRSLSIRLFEAFVHRRCACARIDLAGAVLGSTGVHLFSSQRSARCYFAKSDRHFYPSHLLPCPFLRYMLANIFRKRLNLWRHVSVPN